MSLVLNEYTGDGVTTTFNFAMVGGYLSRDFVVFLTRPNDKLLEYSTYTGTVTWLSDFSVRVNDPIPVGTTFVITRRTDAAALVDFQNTSRITERNLDTAFGQSLHRTAELEDVTARRAEASSRLAEAAVGAARDAAESAATSTTHAATAASLVAAANAAAVESAMFAQEAASQAEAATDTADEALALIQQAVKGNVDSFKGRDGAVLPERGDYTPDMVGFEHSGVLAPVEDFSPVPAWSNPMLNAQAQSLANRTELIKSAVLYYTDHDAASAATTTLPDGQRVEIDADEMRGGSRTQYKVDGGELSFTRYVDQLRIDLTQPTGNDPAGGFDAYSKLDAYSGSATRIKIKDPTGVHWWVKTNSGKATNIGTVRMDANGNIWEREKLGSAIRPEWFGILTVENGGGDISPMIDKALGVMREAGKPLMLDAGWYIHSLPIVLMSSDWVMGAGVDKTTFQKSTNTPASGLPIYLAPGLLGDLGTEDDYNVDACFILLPNESRGYVRDIRISGFYSESRQTSRSTYGLYAPRLCLSHFQDLAFSSITAIYSRDAWMIQWDRVRGGRCGVAWFIEGGLAPDGSRYGGTSNTFNSCWAHDWQEIGWYIRGLHYSTMNACGADNGATQSDYPACSYRFDNSNIVMNGVGTEGVTGGFVFLDNKSKVTIHGGFAGYMNERSSEVAAIPSVYNVIEVGGGSTLILDNTALEFAGVEGKVRPYLVYGEGSQIQLRGSTKLPTGVMVDVDGNQWGRGIVKSQTGFDVLGYAKFSGVGGVLSVQKAAPNCTVIRNGVGDYSISVTGIPPGGFVASMSTEFKYSVIVETDSVVRYQFKDDSGAPLDPTGVNWTAL